MFEQLDGLEAEHAQLEQKLADPAIHSDQREAQKLGRRYAELTGTIIAGRVVAWQPCYR